MGNLGILLENVRKDYEGAERHYRKAIELDPNGAEVHYSLGVVLHERKDYDGAEKMYQKAIDLDPSYVAPLWNLSLILKNQKNDIPGAIKLMEEYVNLGGNSFSNGKQRLAKLRAKLET